jgi:hypothetical protein
VDTGKTTSDIAGESMLLTAQGTSLSKAGRYYLYGSSYGRPLALTGE